jgi:hypothetical protein
MMMRNNAESSFRYKGSRGFCCENGLSRVEAASFQHNAALEVFGGE